MNIYQLLSTIKTQLSLMPPNDRAQVHAVKTSLLTIIERWQSANPEFVDAKEDVKTEGVIPLLTHPHQGGKSSDTPKALK